MSLCAYCGVAELPGRERPEHPVPAAIGSSLVVRTVCDPCNQWAGRHVDRPFLDDDQVRLLRATHDVRDHRHSGRAVAHPLGHGTTEEGDHVTVDDAGRPRVQSRIVERDDGTATVRAHSMGEAMRLVERVRARALGEGKHIEVARSEVRRIRPTVNVDFHSDLKVWTRMIAKIALAVASEAYTEDWRSSGDARHLRKLLRDGQDEGKVAIPETVDDGHVFRQLAVPPEHLVCFLGYSTTQVVVVLFGSKFFAAPVDTTGRPVPQVAWRLDPRRPRVSGRTTFNGLVARAVRQQVSPG